MSYEALPRDLNSILNSFLDLIGCDGGSIYTMQKNLQGENVLVFKSMITRSANINSVPEELKSLVFRLDETTLVGKTGLNQKVYKESYAAPIVNGKPDLSRSDSWNDVVEHYYTRNILSAPLITPRGDLVGVVQLINKIPFNIELSVGFDERDERLCAVVSGQAALAIENSTLVYEQEKILEGFVNACVTAIEARDPVTSGHSQRVCDLTLNLAEAVNRESRGPLAFMEFNSIQMRELRYAAMLHDIGKISVKENILQKEKKLFPWELEIIEMRFKMMKIATCNQYSAEKDVLEKARKLKELEKALTLIKAANEPTLLPQEVSEGIAELTKLQVKVDEEEYCCALHQREKERLSIKKGSLSAEERLEIEKHVSFTYEILKMVPWGRGLERVPDIAHYHHEKLDGTGYPMGVKSESISTQSRMLAVCDIYDALTAKDRPYKAAVGNDVALRILEDEVKQGKLDALLFKLFVDSKAYELPFLPGKTVAKTVKKVA
jgi:HD-GYP domain-containing protein (c-di-GMP phosphodiesterase class II)